MNTPDHAVSNGVLPTIACAAPAQRYNSADASPVPPRESVRARADRESRRRASEPPMPPSVQVGAPTVPCGVSSLTAAPLNGSPRPADAKAHTVSQNGHLPMAVPTTPPAAALGKPLSAVVSETRAANGRPASRAEDRGVAASPVMTHEDVVSGSGETPHASLTQIPGTSTALPAIASARGRRGRLRQSDAVDLTDADLADSKEMEALKRLLQSQSARLEKRVEEVGTSTTPIPYGAASASKQDKKSKRKAKDNTSSVQNGSDAQTEATTTHSNTARTSPAEDPMATFTPPEPRPGEAVPRFGVASGEGSVPPTANMSVRQSQESPLTELSMTGVQYGAARIMQDYTADRTRAFNESAGQFISKDASHSVLSAEDSARCSSTTASESEMSFSSLDDEDTIKSKKAAKTARAAAAGAGGAGQPRQGRRATATPSSAGIASGARYFVLEQAPMINVNVQDTPTSPKSNPDERKDGEDDDEADADAALAAALAAVGGDRRVSGSLSVLAATRRPDEEHDAAKKVKTSNGGPAADVVTAVTLTTGLVPTTPAQRTSIISDPELQTLSEQMERLQSRMAHRASELQRNWDAPQPSTGKIMPADPSVFSAVSEEEIQRKAMSAESFAKNQAQWRRNRLRASVQEDDNDPTGSLGGQKAQKKKKPKKKGAKWSSEAPKKQRSPKASIRSDTPPFLLSVECSPSGAGDSLECSGRAGGRPTTGDSGSSGEWNAAASGLTSGGFGFASLVNENEAGDTVRRGRLNRGDQVDGDEEEEEDAGGSSSSGGSNPFEPGDPRRLEAERERLMQANDDAPDANESSMVSYALGRMSMASCSIARVTDGALAMMELLANRPDVFMPAPEETALVRQGDVLSAKHVLKVDLQDALSGREGPTGIIASAPYFRIVPKLNVAGVAQANVSAIHTIIQEFRRAHVDGPIVWVNLREEPLIYINNAAHIVRERVDPRKPVIIPNITGRGIEAIEYKLKQEILQEAASSGGNISTYVETNSGMMEDQWEYVDPASVLTLAEVFREVSKQYNPIESAFNRSKHALRVEYFRRPITQNLGPRPEDFDFVFDACLEEPKGIFVFNCQTGRGRTSAMMMIASIVRFYQWCVKDISVDVRVLRSTSNKLAFRTIQKLVSLFPDGKLHERRLNILMDMADKVYSMADHINEAFLSTDAEHAEIAMMRLQQYAYLLAFSYYCEQRLWNYLTKLSFSEWLNENASLKVLINSVREKLDDQLRDERIGADDAGDDAEAARVIRRRHGNVLSAGRILCSMPMPSGSSVRQLRQLAPDTPIFTCGRMGEKGRGELIGQVRSAFPKHRMVHWLSLRAEPMVLINDVSYTLAEYSSHLKGPESMTTMHVSLETIEQLEDRLRRDVLLESQENGGTILLHTMNEQGERTKQNVRVRSVRTSKSMMDAFAERTGIAYHRVPIPFSGQMLATDVDPLLRYLAQTGQDPDDVVILADSEGSTRTTAALNVLTIYRASRLGDLRSVQSPSAIIELLRASDANVVLPSAHLAGTTELAASDVPDHPVELLLASTICQMLTAGTLLQTVDAAISLGGRGKNWNILHMLDFLKSRIGKIGSNKPQCILDALHGLRCYLLVLLTALYLDDTGNYTDEYPFSKWVEDHTEVSHIIDTLPSRGEAALRYISTENLMKADLSRRHGDVLTANFCLKADHFPGCQKKGLRPVVCGAPNFRKVAFINVFGVAIPTRLGIHNILSLLGASNEPMRTYPGERNDDELFLGFAAPRLFDPTFKSEELAKPLRGSVVWVNLREEPILYVGDKPCVFRDLERPYVNVELTGIQTSKIEQVESQLMDDVLNEAEQYDGKFLIHDEGNPGELVGKWEKATESTIKTVRNIYDDLSTKGIRVRFQRLPVTDEQSPDIEDFDALVEALLPRITEHLDRRETLSFVFNCQMGRGRTTTGMVICSLLIGLVTPEYYDELHNLYNPLYKDDESELSKGEYKVITQLKRVLTNGRQAKYRVDLVLEACSRMQNLRTAIEAFAIQLTSPDLTEQGRAHAHHAGVHYLIRYFNIIVFSVYLEECYDRMRKRMRRTFKEWMASHPELTTLCGTAALA